jgi:cytochrome c peroxidase
MKKSPLWSVLIASTLTVGCGSGSSQPGGGTAAPATPPTENAAPAAPAQPAAPDANSTTVAPAAEALTLPVAKLDPATVELGGDDLTAGIPGSGPLTTEQIRQWLGDPENHRTLVPTLPLGLSAAQANIQHIDKNPLTRAKIELGRQLYFDGRLSSDGTVSCASCHHPDSGFSAHTQFGVGVKGQTGNRNSPVSYNRIISGPQFWDGRADSLEAQAAGPIQNPIEMGSSHEKAVATVKSLEGYQLQFDAVFPGEGITIDTITQAIASFERALVSLPAPYDHYEKLRTIVSTYGETEEDLKALQEDDPDLFAEYEKAKAGAAPMSESARRGRELFFSERSNCTACHAGANFADEKFHNLGVGMAAEKPDLGRFVVSKQEADKGSFKTPTLRNVTLSAPYMHDGSQATLEEVVDWYAKGGHPNEHLSDKMKKLDLTDQEKKDIVAFMVEGLTSGFPKIETGRLPE